jgi:hypothetical protein
MLSSYKILIWEIVFVWKNIVIFWENDIVYTSFSLKLFIEPCLLGPGEQVEDCWQEKVEGE